MDWFRALIAATVDLYEILADHSSYCFQTFLPDSKKYSVLVIFK